LFYFSPNKVKINIWILYFLFCHFKTLFQSTFNPEKTIFRPLEDS
jgi:hypothetical protein